MLQSPVSPESPDVKRGARAFERIHNYEAGLEVAENQNREKNDRDPVVVLNSPVDVDSPMYVTHGRWAEAPQPIDTTSPQAMGDAALESNRAPTTRTESDAAKAEMGSTLAESEKEEPKCWCGLSGKVLLLIIILVLLLVAAVVGGAVGGTLGKKNKSTPAPGSSIEGENGTASASRTKASIAAEPTGPHVRFRLQTYDDYDTKGNIQVFTEPGLYKPAWTIYSYVWSPARSGDYYNTDLLRCSVAFCVNKTVVGWCGASDKHQPGQGMNHSTNFLHIACDKLNVNPECEGLDDPAVTAKAQTKDEYSIPPTATETGDGTVESTQSSTLATTTPSSKSSKSTSRSLSRSTFASASASTSASGSTSHPSSTTSTQA